MLVILALAAAMVAPSMMRFAHGRVGADAAGRLLALMHYAQDQAMNDGTPWRLQVDPAQGTYALMVQRQGNFVSPRTDLGRTFALPKEVTARWESPADISSRDYVQFNADGRHDVATLRLTDRDGTVMDVTCDAMAEPYRVESSK